MQKKERKISNKLPSAIKLSNASPCSCLSPLQPVCAPAPCPCPKTYTSTAAAVVLHTRIKGKGIQGGQIKVVVDGVCLAWRVRQGTLQLFTGRRRVAQNQYTEVLKIGMAATETHASARDFNVTAVRSALVHVYQLADFHCRSGL